MHIAHALAREGVDLVLAARSTAALWEVWRAAGSSGVRALAASVVLAARDSLESLVRPAEQTLGRVDILINNAGVLHTQDCGTLDPDAIDETLHLDLRAPMLLTRLLLRGTVARGERHIVNISSVAGLGGAACSFTTDTRCSAHTSR